MDNRYDNLDEAGKKIFDDVVAMSSYFDRISYPTSTDHSKCYVIFAYNYMTLGFPELATRELKKVRRSYFDGKIMNDIAEAKDHWNQAVDYWDNNRNEQGFKSQIEAEFLFCLLSVVTLMHQDIWTINGENWNKFLNDLSTIKLDLKKPNDPDKLKILHKYLGTVKYYNDINRSDINHTVDNNH